MKLLAIDVGTGTQDILLFDTEREPENCVQLVLPSPTVIVADRIRAATAAGKGVLLTGVTMGGGPSAWAAEAHRKAGLPLWATPDAARTFNDDLEQVAADLGLEVVSDDEAASLGRREDVERVELRDLMLPEICAALAAGGVRPEFDALAVAVFDHGNAPRGVSDRAFRFDYLRSRLQAGLGLAGFAFRGDEIPESMTRLRAVAALAPSRLPLAVMDTAPAAVLGSLDDPRVAEAGAKIVVNVGNFHTLAFALLDGQVAGLFEHHTGLVDAAKLERLIRRLAAGQLANEEVFADHGHGAISFDRLGTPEPFTVVLGPRRGMLRASSLPRYEAVPHGDMMLAGCFGLVRAFAALYPAWRDAIEAALAR
ncbi:hypothetical protein HRbin29_00383 [bacterium HR29]|jgi:uncharacterized protein (DUF1786 family)|nr:hypothetical protein HRbin29_00383 [bacterium HR29]